MQSIGIILLIFALIGAVCITGCISEPAPVSTINTSSEITTAPTPTPVIIISQVSTIPSPQATQKIEYKTIKSSEHEFSIRIPTDWSASPTYPCTFWNAKTETFLYPSSSPQPGFSVMEKAASSGSPPKNYASGSSDSVIIFTFPASGSNCPVSNQKTGLCGRNYFVSDYGEKNVLESQVTIGGKPFDRVEYSNASFDDVMYSGFIKASSSKGDNWIIEYKLKNPSPQDKLLYENIVNSFTVLNPEDVTSVMGEELVSANRDAWC
jgi:hypothetical protein